MDIRNTCPPIVMSKFRMSPVGRTELVSAIRSKNGHGSESLIPNVSHVRWLITFTPEPPSIIVLVISFPLIITIIVGLLMSTTTGPSSRLEKNVGAGSGFCEVNAILRPFVNRGANCSRRPRGSMI